MGSPLVSPELRADKAAFVRAGIEKLERIPQASLDEFQSDFRNLDATLHELQTVIQALIDLGASVVAERGLRTPRTSLDVLTVLEDAAAVPPEIVYRVLTEEREDLRALLGLLLAAGP
jgi:uncharacterized protein YutE (UPF0331/DUF86 family)